MPAKLHKQAGFIKLHVLPGHHLSLCDGSGDDGVRGQAGGQSVQAESLLGTVHGAVEGKSAEGVKTIAGTQVTLGDRHHVSHGPIQGHKRGLLVEMGASHGKRRLQEPQVVGAEQGRVPAVADLEVLEVGGNSGFVDPHDHEHTPRHCRSLDEIHDARVLADPAVLDQGEQSGHGLRRRCRTGHTALQRPAAAGVGSTGHLEHRFGAVHVRCRLICILPHLHGGLGDAVGRGVGVERVVLALTDGDDLVSQTANKVMQLHQAARLISRRDRVQHTGVPCKLM